jgi:hypothetical protein
LDCGSPAAALSQAALLPPHIAKRRFRQELPNHWWLLAERRNGPLGSPAPAGLAPESGSRAAALQGLRPKISGRMDWVGVVPPAVGAVTRGVGGLHVSEADFSCRCLRRAAVDAVQSLPLGSAAAHKGRIPQSGRRRNVFPKSRELTLTGGRCKGPRQSPLALLVLPSPTRNSTGVRFIAMPPIAISPFDHRSPSLVPIYGNQDWATLLFAV